LAGGQQKDKPTYGRGCRLTSVLCGSGIYSGHKKFIHRHISQISRLDTDGIDFNFVLVDNTHPFDKSFNSQLKKSMSDFPYMSVVDKRYDSDVDRPYKILDSVLILRDIVLDEGYDYFLSWETGIFVEDVSALKKLIRHNKDVVTIYGLNWPVCGSFEEVPFDYDFFGAKFKPVERRERGLVKVGWSTTGFVLFSSKVLKRVKFRCDLETHGNWGIDRCFSYDCHKLGIPIYCDFDITLTHKH